MRRKRLAAGLLSLSLALSSAGCFGPAGETAALTDPEEAVLSAGDAIDRLEQREWEYENAYSELTEKNTSRVGGDSYYRLQQNYQGLPVYGRTVVYVTDEEGNTTSVTGNAADVDEDVDLTPSITQAQAEESIRGFAGNDSLEVGLLSDGELCLFISPQDGATHLAYVLEVGANEVVIDAHDAQVLRMAPVVWEETVTGYVASDTDRTRGFNVDKRAEYYYLMGDPTRDTVVYTFNKRVSYENDVFFPERAGIVESTDNIFGNSEAETELEYEKGAQLLATGTKIHDYFKEMGFVPLTKEIRFYYNDGFDNGDNALGGTISDYGVVSVGWKENVNSLGLVGHEYTHYVTANMVGWSGADENSAINEGVSDIFGEILEAVLGGGTDWIHGDRVLYDPSVCDYPETPGSKTLEDGWMQVSDWQGNIRYTDYSHGYSTVISHAAYLMCNDADMEEAENLTIYQLAELWYRAILMMPSDADFARCREAVELAAASMEDLSAAQRRCVSGAFDAVGIISDEERTPAAHRVVPGSDLCVYDREREFCTGYKLDIYGIIATHEIASAFVGDMQNVYERSWVVEEAGPLRLDLYDGIYRFTVSYPHSEQVYTFLVEVSPQGTQSEISLVTDFEEPLVVVIPDNPVKVSDAYVYTLWVDGLSRCYHIPRIDLPEDRAWALNQELYSLYYGMIQEEVIDIMAEYDFWALGGIVYELGQKGDVASLVVQIYDETISNTGYDIYQIDAKTGQKVSQDRVLEAFGLTWEAFYAALREDLETYWAGEESTKSLVGEEQFQRLVDDTLDEENLRKAIPYINREGELCAMVGIYWPAGAGYYRHLLNVSGSWEIDYLECAEEHEISAPVENTADWAKRYAEFIRTDRAEAEYQDNWDYVSYELIWLDDDQVPELWITYQSTADGCRLVTLADGQVAARLFGSGGLGYQERSGVFAHNGGRQGVYFDDVWRLDEGALTLLGEGDCVESDSSVISFTYKWDGEEVSEETYKQILEEYLGTDAVRRTGDAASVQYTYDEILEYLAP